MHAQFKLSKFALLTSWPLEDLPGTCARHHAYAVENKSTSTYRINIHQGLGLVLQGTPTWSSLAFLPLMDGTTLYIICSIWCALLVCLLEGKGLFLDWWSVTTAYVGNSYFRQKQTKIMKQGQLDHIVYSAVFFWSCYRSIYNISII